MKMTWADLNSLDVAEVDFRPPVLALHGAASSGQQWHGLSDYLRGRYRLHAPDLAGYGDAQLNVARGMEQIAASLIAAMQRNDAPMHVVGHLHGAALAMEVAMSRPDLVLSLTLIEPAVYHLLRDGDPNDVALFAALSVLAEEIDTAVGANVPAAAMRAYIDFWHGKGAWGNSSGALRHKLAAQAARVASDLAASLARSWPLGSCARLVCPTLAVMALESPLASLRVTEMVAEAIPGARLVMVPDAGHMAPLTDPHIIDPLIAAHLRAADRSGRNLRAWHNARAWSSAAR